VPQALQGLEVLTDYKVNKEQLDQVADLRVRKVLQAHKARVLQAHKVLEALQEIQVLRVDQQV
jgi:hypothetical protein